MGKTKDTLVERTFSYITENGLANPGETVLVALSGGADSVCLFDILMKLSKRLDINVCAYHLNHMIRKEAGRDESFVEEFCRERGARLFSERADIPEIANEKNLGLEQAGREARYERMEKIADENGIEKIATAHHLSDNAESVILNMARGAGLKGLCGIEPERGRLIRPILFASKEEILEYMKEEDLSWVEDESNSDISYARNRIRHRVIPELEQINEKAQRNIERLSETCREYLNFIEECLSSVEITGHEGFASVSFDEFSSLHPVMKKHLLFKMAEAASSSKDVGSAAVKAVLKCAERGESSFDVSTSNALVFRRRYERLICEKDRKPTKLEKTVICPGKLLVTEEFSLVLENGTAGENNCLKYIAKNRINGTLYVRGRKPSDAFTPFGFDGTKSVKKYMIEKKIPKEKRDSVPILFDDDGILAVCGLDIADRAKTESTTDEVLFINYKPARK